MGVQAQDQAKRPWMDQSLSPDDRADRVLRKMTLSEKLRLLHGPMPMLTTEKPDDMRFGGGYIAGVKRLGVPSLNETDASLGVASKVDRGPTALPSGLAAASTWNPARAYESGAMIGREAHRNGYNVLLAGGINLVRDPAAGRNFEYLGEDPLLAGVMAGESVRGIQSEHVISTVKHFALNAQESGRRVVNARIDEGALRESDLLAFQIAIERGNPGVVMCAYNKVNGAYACENDFLLNLALKRDWAFPGWVMSDWGAVHSTKEAALAGLDQQSGEQLDDKPYFGALLKRAVEAGDVPKARIDDMARRVLRSMFAVGTIDHPATSADIDLEANAKIAQRTAEEGIVLLKNARATLPLAGSKIAVIGGHADVGVMSGGGSSTVRPLGFATFPLPKDVPPWLGGITYHPSSPLKAIAAHAGEGAVTYADGEDIPAAMAAAKTADVAVVFATQWTTEEKDAADLDLPGAQNALIESVAAVNPRTVVVLETGGPVSMPWLPRVAAVLEAWYPGARGGEAIARVLFGEVNPSGRLPVTFPQDAAQLPRPSIPRPAPPPPDAKPIGPLGLPPEEPVDVDYPEGSNVGYRWFAVQGQQPLFPFGYGLSYTAFRYGRLEATGGETVTASFDVTNTGKRAGMTTPQLYAEIQGRNGKTVLRLIAWEKLHLEPGERRRVTVKADPRLLANFNTAAGRWEIAGDAVRLHLGDSAVDLLASTTAPLEAQALKP